MIGNIMVFKILLEFLKVGTHSLGLSGIELLSCQKRPVLNLFHILLKFRCIVLLIDE